MRLDERFENIHTAIDTDCIGMNRKMIILGCAPTLGGVLVIICRTLFVAALNILTQVFGVVVIVFLHTFDTGIHIGIQEEIDQIVLFLEYIIRAASDNDARTFGGTFLNDIRLDQKDLIR